MTIGILLAVIELSGVTGAGLRARAFFDANNVKVGDPLVLTVDFLGQADFRALHPPKLAHGVNRADWKIDDVSAKTDTYRDARRLTYRVRPMREGVLWFPALEFGYATPDGERMVVRSNQIPVHAKPGAQVVVAEMGDDLNEMPAPAGLVTDPAKFVYEPVELTDDARFAWRRACAKPTADAFAAFDFAAAKLNEATCAVREGNWARALKVYGRLEWRIGQTPEIERGIVAALALRYDNPAVELPVWRQVGRPLLRYAWPMRVGLTVGAVLLIALVLWLLGKAIRAFACLVLVAGLALPASAQAIDPDAFFKQARREHEQMINQMHSMMSVMSGGKSEVWVNGVRQAPIAVRSSLALETARPTVGEEVNVVVSLEVPRSCSLDSLNVSFSSVPGMEFLSRSFDNLADGKSANPSNVVKRMATSVRFMSPWSGRLGATVTGQVMRQQRRSRGMGFFFGSMSFGEPFEAKAPAVALAVRPPPEEGRPEGYAGIVAEGLRIHETLDLLKVETNDVIRITYRMFSRGYVPEGFLPPGAAFEMGRNAEEGLVEYRRFFVADGTNATPRVTVPYYDPRTKAYRKAETGGTHVDYK